VISCSFLRETLTLYDSRNLCRVTEMHMFLVTLIRQFEFALPDDGPKIRRRRPVLVSPPSLRGRNKRGFSCHSRSPQLENQ
jgi:hypothetical protein